MQPQPSGETPGTSCVQTATGRFQSTLSAWLAVPRTQSRFQGWRQEGLLGWGLMAAVLAQLLFVVAVAQWLSLEAGRGFTSSNPGWASVIDPIGGGLLGFLAVAFAIHIFLPSSLRMPFFLAVSLLGAIHVMGIDNGLLLIGFGLGLFGLCHLPIPYPWRVGLVLVAGLVLALFRSGTLPSSFAASVLPILAALFMFRIIIYLYDLRHERNPAGVWQRLSYFFLAPNVCFPLFPVVDYGTFVRTWYDGRELAIYQKGVRWMSRGIFQLVLYRLVYQHLSPAPSEVDDLAGVVLFIVSSYLLYLRISGQFHLIIGTLCLFGFNLPETHHRYLLASGFSDYWRRINIYWKDFMMKLVFYPAYTRFKAIGHLGAIAAGTGLVFLATWLFHGYQWFWLRGSFHFSLVDGLFWGFFALLVIVNALHEAGKKPERKPGSSGTSEFDFPAAIRRSLQTGAMFALVCLLFAFWQNDSVHQFLALLGQARNTDLEQVVMLVSLAVLALALGVFFPWLQHRWKRRWNAKPASSTSVPWIPIAATVIPLASLLVIANDRTRRHLPTTAAEILASIRANTLNERDRRTLERGYYEELLQRESFGSPLWEVRLQRRPDWQPLENTGMSRFTGDILHHELVPDQEIEIEGRSWRTNRWAMHDHDHYSRKKPPGVYRIALLSASYGAGYGVPVEATFENQVEARLNQLPGLTVDRIEILNFSVPGYTLIEFVAFLETRIAAFEPDALYLVTHSKEGPRTLGTLARRIKEGTPLAYPYLESLVKRAGLTAVSDDQELRKISKYRDEIEDWGYGRLVDFCARNRMKPVWIHLPATDETVDPTFLGPQKARAEAAGFTTMTLEGAYGDGNPEEIFLSPHDRHPNAEGHQRIANRFLQELLARSGELELPIRQGDSGSAPVDDPVPGRTNP